MLTLRSNRIFILGFVSLLLTTLYFLYPTDHFRSPHAPSDTYDEYEAGGIDSDHWREPVRPNFEKEVARDEDCDDGACAVEPEVARTKERVKPRPKRPVKPAKEALAAGLAKGGEKMSFVVEDSVLAGGVIMPKLENATARLALSFNERPS